MHINTPSSLAPSESGRRRRRRRRRRRKHINKQFIDQ
jgi:hypothetical protein